MFNNINDINNNIINRYNNTTYTYIIIYRKIVLNENLSDNTYPMKNDISLFKRSMKKLNCGLTKVFPYSLAKYYTYIIPISAIVAGLSATTNEAYNYWNYIDSTQLSNYMDETAILFFF